MALLPSFLKPKSAKVLTTSPTKASKPSFMGSMTPTKLRLFGKKRDDLVIAQPQGLASPAPKDDKALQRATRRADAYRAQVEELQEENIMLEKKLKELLQPTETKGLKNLEETVSSLRTKIQFLEMELKSAREAGVQTGMVATPPTPVVPGLTASSIPPPPPLPNTAESDDFIARGGFQAVYGGSMPTPAPSAEAASAAVGVAALMASRVKAPSSSAPSNTNIPTPPPLPGTQGIPALAGRPEVTVVGAPSSSPLDSSSTTAKPSGPVGVAALFAGRGGPPGARRATAPDLKRRPSIRPSNNKEALKNVFWDVLSEEKAKNTVWSSISDKKDSSLEAHFKTLESRFAKRAAKPLKKAAVQKKKSSVDPARPKLLDGTRQQNLGIALSTFKGQSFKDLRKSILKLDTKALDIDVIQRLLTIAPTTEEMALVKALTADKQKNASFFSSLSREEEFVVEMASIPRLRQRLQCLFVEESFNNQADELEIMLKSYSKAISTLDRSKNWKELLKLVLSAGNYVNEGSKGRAGAWGIQLTTGLPKLAQCKSSDSGKFSLLHWIAEVADAKSPELFDLVEEFASLKSVQECKVDDLKVRMAHLKKGVDMVSRELENATNNTKEEGAKDFQKKMAPFLKKNALPLKERLQALVNSVSQASVDVVVKHGENKNTVNSQKLFGVILNFVNSLAKARDENQIARVTQQKAARMESQKVNAVDPALAGVSRTLGHQMKKDRLSQSFKRKRTVDNDELKNAMAARQRK